MQTKPGTARLQVAPGDNIRLIGPPTGVLGWSGMKFITIGRDDERIVVLDIECDDNEAHVSRCYPG